ncbi:AI-2E family transporter [uncultured Enterovirga sp.]|uniref:AI-2E family transporter n=1 Tax=uncultured Enterovirga sp. TaxID=2026352 RepID=UPI0035C9A29E
MQRQVVLWVGAGLVALGVLYLLGDILLPFVVGAALAYLLDPLADRLERIGIGRLGATIVILCLFVLVFVLGLVVLVPIVVNQIVAFAEQLPTYVQRLQVLIAEQGAPLVERVGGQDALAQVQRAVGDLVGQGAAWVATFLRSLWSGGKAVAGVVSILVVTPVVAFYLLVDWDRMIRTIDSWVPPRNRATVRRLGREMDRAVSGFVRGQSTVCLFLAVFYATGLTVIGLNFGGLIGMMAGLISFVPYVGSLTGLFVSVGVALVQFLPDWTWVGVTLGVFLVGQFIEGNILSPKLVGDAVGLHPVWLMFALLAFGSLFGFVGLLLAVPLSAMIGVLARFALQRYRESAMYLGTEAIAPPPEATPIRAGSELDG